MALVHSPGKVLLCAASATTYPLGDDPAGTGTVGSSTAIGKRVAIDSISVIISGAATITISDHGGTAGTDLVIPASTAAGPISLGPYGFDMNWVGLKVVTAGAAACIVVYRFV